MDYRFVEVLSSKERRLFCDCARHIYQNDPNWVAPSDMEIKEIFDPKKNPFYKHGSAVRWVLLDSNNLPVGRIAAFINLKKAHTFEQATGGIGFFECIDRQEVASLLFDKAKDWLSDRGMEAMDGPINFGENDRFWGLLVEGFEQPVWGLQYNFPYYQKLFENYGFFPYFEQYSASVDLEKPFSPRMLKIAEWVSKKENISITKLDKSNIEKFGQDFLLIYNEAWQHHPNFAPMTQEQMDKMIKQLKFTLIEEICIFAYVKGQPAGFIICMPDLNQIFKPFKGRLNWLELILFLWRKRNKYKWYRERKILNQIRALILGVRPAYQKYGIETAMMTIPMKEVLSMGLTKIGVGWVGDFNPNMKAILEESATENECKKHITYRFLFDRSLEKTQKVEKINK